MTRSETQFNQAEAAVAKEMARGELGTLMTRYPLRYAKAVFFGERPVRGNTSKINNGTVTLLDLNETVFAITCAHVIEGYLKFLRESGSGLFQIGETEIEIPKQLHDLSNHFDLASIQLTDRQVSELRRQGEIGSEAIKAVKWPPAVPRVGDRIMFGGFPGALRERVGFDELIFNTFSAAGIRIESVDSEKFACVLERDFWVSSNYAQKAQGNLNLKEFGGLSGGPAFIDRGLHFEFAGIVYEHSPNFDILFLRPANLIQLDGRISASMR